MADKLKPLILGARKSKWGLMKFNLIMSRMIPFNKPHKIRVLEVEKEKSRVLIPFRFRNFNHIKGIHACGLATAGEYCAGLLLLSNLPSDKYRLIMKSLHAEYHYQAKKDVVATYEISEIELKNKILDPLMTEDLVYHTCKAELQDSSSNHIATITTEWQIKRWSKVKAKL